MVDKPNAAKLRAQQKAKEFLTNPDIVARIGALEPTSPDCEALVKEVQALYENISSAEVLIDFAVRMLPGTPTAAAFQDLQTKLKNAKTIARAQSGTASHRQKRHFIHSTGLNGHGRSIEDILASQNEPSVGSPLNPRIIWRTRTEAAVPRYTVLADARCRLEDDHIVNEANGYLTLGPSESIVILAGTASEPVKKNGQYVVELVALQGVLADGMSAPIYSWMSSVIGTAASERRNVRPTHEGKMVQIGYNAGPWHARVFGPAKSYDKVLDHATMIEHDEDVISAMALTWGVFRAFMPSDVIAIIDGHLKDAGLPAFGTRNVESGTGYRFTIDGTEYRFPDFERGPCEMNLTQNYSAWSHTDDCYAGFCLDWTVDRQDRAPGSTFSTAPTIPGVQTRRSRHHQEPQFEFEPVPEAGGANIVDLTLKVKISVKTGTLLAFRPEFLHGTTRLCGAKTRQATISFASRILDAFRKAQQGVTVEKGYGAGEGSD